MNAHGSFYIWLWMCHLLHRGRDRLTREHGAVQHEPRRMGQLPAAVTIRQTSLPASLIVLTGKRVCRHGRRMHSRGQRDFNSRTDAVMRSVFPKYVKRERTVGRWGLSPFFVRINHKSQTHCAAWPTPAMELTP